MKISLVSNIHSWHTQQLVEEAQRQNIELEIVDIPNLNNVQEFMKSLGDVVLWRSSSTKVKGGKTTIIKLLKDKPVLNRAIATQPFVTHKLYQQKIVEALPDINHIETFHFKNKKLVLEAVEQGVLSYPFITKPNLGAQGIGVEIIRSEEDLDTKKIVYTENVFQRFIKNTGDFRAFVVGGKVLGVIKRVAKGDSFLNNISQGGSAHHVTEKEVINAISAPALKIASTFDLAICGVDMIFDEVSQKYFFMEVNTVPQWQGFEGATGINVAKEILFLCTSLADRTTKSTQTCVKEYLDHSFYFMDYARKFHYSSRMYFWTKDKYYYDLLIEMKDTLLGKNETEMDEKVHKMLQKDPEDVVKHTASAKLRRQYFKKYPFLARYNTIMFKHLMVDNVLGVDVRKSIEKHIPNQDLLKLRTELMQDKDAILALSTYAVNFFYFLKFYLKEQEDVVDPEYLYHIVLQSYTTNPDKKLLQFQIYLLTHAIICESKFYFQKVEAHLETYQKMLILLEEIIKNDYFNISLDNKFEFLICSKLCNFPTNLDAMILGESDLSFSNLGNYLIDKHNAKAGSTADTLLRSEHRNVLYLMANMELK